MPREARDVVEHSPQFTLSLLEVLRKQSPVSVLSTSWHGVSFVHSSEIVLPSSGFYLFLLLLLIFFSLLPPFSLLSFIAFCLLCAAPSPHTYVFVFL